MQGEAGQLGTALQTTRRLEAALLILGKLHLLVSRGVYLESVAWRDAELSMVGSALSYQLLTGLMEALERFGDSYSPHLEQATMQAGAQASVPIKFSIKLHIRG